MQKKGTKNENQIMETFLIHRCSFLKCRLLYFFLQLFTQILCEIFRDLKGLLRHVGDWNVLSLNCQIECVGIWWMENSANLLYQCIKGHHLCFYAVTFKGQYMINQISQGKYQIWKYQYLKPLKVLSFQKSPF